MIRRHGLPVAIFFVVTACLAFATRRFQAEQIAAVRSSAANELLAVADLKVQQLAAHRRERLGNANALRHSVFIAQGIEGLLRDAPPARTEQALAVWLRSLATQYGYSSIVIARLDGTIVRQWPGSAETHLPGEDLAIVARAIRTRSPAIRRGAVGDGATMSEIFVPVFRPEDGEPIATIGLEIDVPAALAAAVQWPVPRSTARVSILSGAPGDARKLGVLAEDHRATRERLSNPLLEALVRSPGEVLTVSDRGRDVLAAALGVPGTSLTVVTQVDADEVLALARARALAAVLAVTIVTSALALATVVWLRRISRAAHTRVEALDGKLKGLHAQLAIAERMASVGTLAAGVAHEINNPLAFVLANVSYAEEELKRPDPDRADVAEALAEAREGAHRVRQIVLDLKTFARVEDHAPAVTDLAEATRFALNLVQNEIRHRARLHADVGDVPLVRGSSHRVGQILVNLLVNAAHAIAPGRASENLVSVTARRGAGDTVEIAVRDTGGGIAPEILPRIFDPFFTTKPVGAGTGLGLSICHGIVAQLGGHLRVDSKVGAGTTFHVTLPVAFELQQEVPGEDAIPQRAFSARVLVVDDEPLVASTVARVLGTAYQVECAGDARDALSRVAACRYDAIVCDLMMPDVSGPEFYGALKDRFPSLAPRTVFLTGGAFTDEARAFLAALNAPVVQKPFEPGQLRTAVAKVVAPQTCEVAAA